MKKIRATGLGLAIALLSTHAPLHAQTVDLDNEEARISYAVGTNIGENLLMQGLMDEVELDVFIAGLRDAVSGNVQLDDEQTMTALMTLQQRLMDRQVAEAQAAREQGEAFLTENGQRAEVTTTASGLQYEVLQSGAGTGASPSATDTVLAHYEGRLIDGEVFDSSIARGEPTSFALNQVIPGWTEGLQLMKPGDKWRFFIPPSLAYGPGGSGPIPPNSTLVFDVELLEVNGQ